MFKFNDGSRVIKGATGAEVKLAGELAEALDLDSGETFSREVAISELRLVDGLPEGKVFFDRLLSSGLIFRA